MTDEQKIEILKSAKNIAVYGMSKNKEKAANHVPVYLKSQSYQIIPVNPTADEIEGLKCYHTLGEVEGNIDVLDVFRPSKDIPNIVKEAVERKKSKGDIKVIWVQEGIESAEGKSLAEEAGIVYLENVCILKEHKRLM